MQSAGRGWCWTATDGGGSVLGYEGYIGVLSEERKKSSNRHKGNDKDTIVRGCES